MLWDSEPPPPSLSLSFIDASLLLNLGGIDLGVLSIRILPCNIYVGVPGSLKLPYEEGRNIGQEEGAMF